MIAFQTVLTVEPFTTVAALAVSGSLVFLLASMIARRCAWGGTRRAIWQIAILSLLGHTLWECSGGGWYLADLRPSFHPQPTEELPTTRPQQPGRAGISIHRLANQPRPTEEPPRWVLDPDLGPQTTAVQAPLLPTPPTPAETERRRRRTAARRAARPCVSATGGG